MIDCSTLRLAIFTDTYPPQVNGVACTLERLANAVQERGGAARIFTVADPDADQHPDVVRFPSMRFWAYEQLRLAWPRDAEVLPAVRAFGPTLVHAATEFGVGLAGRRAARRLGVPFVSSYHTSFSAYAEYYHLGVLASPGWHYMRWFHNGGLRTYCPTQAIVDEVEAHGFRNTRVWSRGVDAARFNPVWRSDALRAEMGATPGTVVVAYVGRLAAEKGLGVAIDAVREASAARPGRVRLACVGDGPYEDEVRKRAPAGTWLPGKLHGDALSAAYASADVFIFPSTTDTFGNVMLEAMASGLPVVGADVGPTRELLAAAHGILVPPDDASAFARALVDLVDDSAQLHERREQALRFAATRSWAQVWDTLVTDYLTVHAAVG